MGRVPFSTFGSVVGISLFVLVSSQLLGNVAVIQLAKPNIEDLGDDAKRYAWAVLSFVATIGGNLTITGSAGKSTITSASWVYTLTFCLLLYFQRTSLSWRKLPVSMPT